MHLKNLKLHSNHCGFRCNKSKTILYKYCKNGDPAYRNGFRLEYEFMKRLEQNCPETSFFPRYYQCGLDRYGRPCISMEYIHGVTLETVLEQKYRYGVLEPRMLFSAKELSHICRQIYEALSLLAQNGILYFDLNPNNIIVINSDYDIRLIDFTFCYYISNGADNSLLRIIDDRMYPELPLPLWFEKAMLLFFTRLFYSGDKQYNLLFHPAEHSRNGSNPTCAFFREHYGMLLELVLDPEAEAFSELISEAEILQRDNACYLTYLTTWHDRLQSLFQLELLKF